MSDESIIQQWASTQYCPRCRTQTLVVEWRYRAKPLGSYSVSGQSSKVVASQVPWIKCVKCGAEGEGKWE